MSPSWSFTPDGPMVGSIGEVLPAPRCGLTLTIASASEVDAIAPGGREVEINTTGGKSIAMRGCPPHLLVLKLEKDGTATTVYNGPGAPVWVQSGKPSERNGQRVIGLSRLAKLQPTVPEADRLAPAMAAPERPPPEEQPSKFVGPMALPAAEEDPEIP